MVARVNPAFIGKPVQDWALEDPAGKDVAVFRKVRDEIGERVRRLHEERCALKARRG